jgi:hypothetical protein
MTDKDWELARQLDDIGMIGFQKNRSKAEIKKDALKTARYIKAHKAKMERLKSIQEKLYKPTA